MIMKPRSRAWSLDMLGWYLIPNAKAVSRDEEHLPGQLGSELCQDLSQWLQRISVADKQSFYQSRMKVTYHRSPERLAKRYLLQLWL